MSSSETIGRQWERLTEGEFKVMNLAAAGLQNREIGERLGLSPRTVSNRLLIVYGKMGIEKRSQLPLLLSQMKRDGVEVEHYNRTNSVYQEDWKRLAKSEQPLTIRQVMARLGCTYHTAWRFCTKMRWVTPISKETAEKRKARLEELKRCRNLRQSNNLELGQSRQQPTTSTSERQSTT